MSHSKEPSKERIIIGFLGSGVLVANTWLMGIVTDNEAGPNWAENQLNQYGYEQVDIERKVTLFPDIVGCEVTDAAGVEFTAVDTLSNSPDPNTHTNQVVEGVICLAPLERVGRIAITSLPEQS